MAPRAPLLLALLLATAWAARANPAAVLSFNDQAQQAVRAYGIPSQIASKIYALVHVAQYAAITPGADEELATAEAAYAGHTAMGLLFPWRWDKSDAALQPLIADLPEDVRKQGEAAGRAAALAVVGESLSDRFARYAPFTPAPPNSPPGEYQFTPGQTSALYPQILGTRPLILDSVDEFKPEPALALDSPEYAAELKEVFEIGRNDSTTRTADQTDVAHFWADGNATSAVSGHFNEVAQVLLPSNATVEEAARLFAALNAATWDASIAAYSYKYEKPTWRPITAIRQGDGSNATAAFVDATWTPLLATPPHPEHPSGHSATAGASGAVLDALLGGGQEFTIGTEYPGLADRTYASVQDAVEEVNWSRVYGGVHFKHAVEQGAALGARVAEVVLAQFDDKIDQLRSKAQEA